VITKGERTELRSLIRQRFKVLRAEVEARRAELAVELEERVAAKFADEDKRWADAMFLIDEAAREANRKANDILRGLDIDAIDTSKEYLIVSNRGITKPATERNVMVRNGTKRIDAQVKAAYLQLDRQEAELLTRLVANGLESDEARAFLGEIPTVSALVPADRLLELERSLGNEEHR
jgi:tRNA uridine 5-carbamoylmethylation protein Kti12